MSFDKRKIDITVTLGTGTFGDTGADQVKLTGKRVSAQIIKGALPDTDSAIVRIFGLTTTVLNTLSRLGKPLDYVRNNTVTISAGDDTDGMSQVFTGVIVSSYPDFDGAPDVCLVINANAGLVDLARPVAAISFPDGADVGVIASQIAASMNKAFLNSGVNMRLNTVYLPGSALDQLRSLIQAADIWADPNAGPTGTSLEIWPKNTERDTLEYELSPESGLVGYPRYSDAGISLTALFRPGFIIGAQFQLSSVLVGANGSWNVMQLSYDLESETPDGSWFMDIGAYRPTTAGGTQ